MGGLFLIKFTGKQPPGKSIFDEMPKKGGETGKSEAKH
jgi:hypothetical protein